LQVKRLAAKNKGGRPRKVAAAAAAVKRGPGRPRKVAVVAGPAAAAVTAAAPRVAAPAAGNRDAVRAVLLEFATTVALAEGKAEMIGVVTRVDGWVDRVLKAAG
jgi:hypothetical protein